jgi:hypothetical protein
MAAVMVAGVGVAAFRSGSEAWFRLLYPLTVGVLLFAFLGAKFALDDSRALWLGFGVFGGAYPVRGFGVVPITAQNDDDNVSKPIQIDDSATTSSTSWKA